MRFIIMLFAVCVVATSGHPATINVPVDYPTIQQAIDAAVKGDTVLVAPGIYKENINFLGKAIIVKSSDGAKYTVIDGGQVRSTVLFENKEQQDSVIEGFSIINGYDLSGGGIKCRGFSSPTIRYNDIRWNSAFIGYDGGGGISCEYSHPVITYNSIHHNTAIGTAPGQHGGGIQGTSSNAIVTHNIIHNNMSDYGGGIGCQSGGSMMIADNIIYNNIAEYETGSGGGIACIGSSTSIINNMIFDNVAEGASARGGGIYASAASPLIANNTIVGNKADGAFTYAGGVAVSNISNPIIVNSIIYNNTAAKSEQLYLGGFLTPITLTISYSNVEGGNELIKVEPKCTLNWGDGMIDADPLLEASSTLPFECFLSRLSPCINRGSDDDAPGLDIEGDPRPCMGTSDIGADEFTGSHTLAADAFTLSESTGGAINFLLDGGPENAGRDYLIFGSLSGTAPGTHLPGKLIKLPLNWDAFTTAVAEVCYPNSVFFTDFYGTLDGSGRSAAVFDTNGPVLGMLGYVMSFAYPLQGPPWDFVSSPINVEVVH